MIGARLSLTATGLLLACAALASSAPPPPPAEQLRDREENGRQFLFLNPRASLQSVGFAEPLIPISGFDRVQDSGRESYLYLPPGQVKHQEAHQPQSDVRFEAPSQVGQQFYLYTPGLKQNNPGFAQQFFNLFSGLNPLNPPANQQSPGNQPGPIQQAVTWFSENSPFRPRPAATTANPSAISDATTPAPLAATGARTNSANHKPEAGAGGATQQRFYVLSGQPQFFGSYEFASNPHQPIFSLQPLQPVRPVAVRSQQHAPAAAPGSQQNAAYEQMPQIDGRFQVNSQSTRDVSHKETKDTKSSAGSPSNTTLKDCIPQSISLKLRRSG